MRDSLDMVYLLVGTRDNEVFSVHRTLAGAMDVAASIELQAGRTSPADREWISEGPGLTNARDYAIFIHLILP